MILIIIIKKYYYSVSHTHTYTSVGRKYVPCYCCWIDYRLRSTCEEDMNFLKKEDYVNVLRFTFLSFF